MSSSLSEFDSKAESASSEPDFVFRQGSLASGLLFVLGGFGISIVMLLSYLSVGGTELILVAVWGMLLGAIGLWLLYSRRKFSFFPRHFSVSHLGRSVDLDYSEITDATEIYFRGRGSYRALGFSLALQKKGMKFAFKVGGDDTFDSSDFKEFLRKRVGEEDYHPDGGTRILWW